MLFKKQATKRLYLQDVGGEGGLSLVWLDAGFFRKELVKDEKGRPVDK